MIIRVHPAKCTGCAACEAFCSLEQERMVNPARSRIGITRDERHNFSRPELGWVLLYSNTAPDAL